MHLLLCRNWIYVHTAMHKSKLYFGGFLVRKEHQVLDYCLVTAELDMETDSWSSSENTNLPLGFLNPTHLEPQQVMEIETTSHSSRQKMSFSQPKKDIFTICWRH